MNMMKIIRNKLHFLFIALALSVCGGWLASCDDNSPVKEEPVADYSLTVPSTSEEEILLLPGWQSLISVNVPEGSWLGYAAETSEEGVPQIRFIVKDAARNTSRSQLVTFKDAAGKQGSVNVVLALDSDNGENGDNLLFLTDWENQDTVEIYYDRGISAVKTPWSSDAMITTLPEEICDDVKKEDGWEMAFSKLGTEALEGANYFGLYNKFTGILRIFYYVSNVWNNGSEYCLEVDMGNKSANVKFPFYNALNYAIPTSFSKLNNSQDLLGLGNVQTTFKTFVTPHSNSSSTALSLGWTAFDVDASGFCPDATPWKTSKESMNLHIKSTQTSLITLCGSLTADITGNFSQIQEATASTSSGVGKVFSQIGKYGTQASGVVGTITKAVWGTDISGVVKGVAGACNVAGTVIDWMLENPYEEKAAVDSMAGKIVLAMTGDINMSGTIKSDASNSCPPLTIRAASFLPSHFGEGVWSLKKSPVVYIVGDQMLGDVNRFTLQCYGDGKYGIGQDLAGKDNLRMVTFLDPESIELNINPKVFPDISDVEVVAANFGVYPKENASHTAKYRKLLSLTNPTVQISDAKSGIWRSYTASNKVKYYQITAESLISPAIYEKESNCAIYSQAGANYKYYGSMIEEFGKPYIQNPQIFFPATSSDSDAMIYDGETPDLVVTVVVKFKSNGRTFMFSQRYLPEVKVISGNDVKNRYAALKNYKTKCQNGSPINNVNGTPVKHTSGTATVERIIKIFDKTLK